jgi:hypothetical protein
MLDGYIHFNIPIWYRDIMIISIFIDKFGTCIKKIKNCIYKFGLNYNLKNSKDMKYEHEDSRTIYQTI